MRIASIALWLCVSATTAGAQTVAEFADLLLRVNIGDTLSVTDATGGVVRGRLVEFTPRALVLAGAGTRRVTIVATDVRQISTRGDRATDGALKGLGTGVTLGLIGGAAAQDGPGAVGAAFLLGSALAGLGALTDAAIQPDRIIYRARATLDRSELGPFDAPNISPSDPFSGLPAVLDLDDDVSIVDMNGTTWRGRLTALTPSGLEVRGTTTVTLPRDRVREVRLCCDSLKNGALIGGISLGVLGFASGYSFAGRDSVGDGLVGAAMSGGLGAGLGVAIDALIRRDVTVWRRQP